MLASCQHQYINWYSMAQTWRSLHLTSYRLALILMTQLRLWELVNYLVHPDTKKLVETIFYVATNDESVLLSCKSRLALDLIQPRSRLAYLPPQASLITSTKGHPKKTKQVQAPVQVHTSKKLSAQASQKPKQAKHPMQKISCKHQQQSHISLTR